MAKAPPTIKAPSLFLAKKAVRPAWENQHSEKRQTGRPLQRARKKLFWDEPLCRMCKAEGRVRIATIRDHIIPLAEGGTEDPSNTQPLCQEHHDIKTREEAIRGQRRMKQG